MRVMTLRPRATIFAGLAIVATALGACGTASETLAPHRAPRAALMSRDPEATEVGYFNGVVYRWQFPSGGSNNQNELVLPDCFRVGSDFTAHDVNAAVGVLYAVFLPNVTQHACPDGTDLHDHVLSVVPGEPGSATFWDLKEVVQGPNWNPGVGLLTSEAAIKTAESLGQVIVVDDQIILHVVVLGPVH